MCSYRLSSGTRRGCVPCAHASRAEGCCLFWETFCLFTNCPHSWIGCRFLSGCQTNCVTRQRTRTQGAAKPWNQEGRFCALWRGNLPAPSTATCVVFQVFKGRIFSVGKRLESYRKCSRCSAFLEWKFPRLKRNLCGNSAGKLCHVDWVTVRMYANSVSLFACWSWRLKFVSLKGHIDHSLHQESCKLSQIKPLKPAFAMLLGVRMSMR